VLARSNSFVEISLCHIYMYFSLFRFVYELYKTFLIQQELGRVKRVIHTASKRFHLIVNHVIAPTIIDNRFYYSLQCLSVGPDRVRRFGVGTIDRFKYAIKSKRYYYYYCQTVVTPDGRIRNV